MQATCWSWVVRFPIVLNARWTTRMLPSTWVVAMSPIVTLMRGASSSRWPDGGLIGLGLPSAATSGVLLTYGQ